MPSKKQVLFAQSPSFGDESLLLLLSLFSVLLTSFSEAFNSCLLRLRSPSTSVIVVEITGAATEEVTAAPSAIEPIEVAAAKSCAPSAMEPMEVTVGSLLAQQQGFSSLQIQSEPLNRHAQLASAAVSTLNKCWSGTSKTAPCFELSDGSFFRPPQRSVIVISFLRSATVDFLRCLELKFDWGLYI